MRLARGLLVVAGLFLVFALLFVWVALPPILGGVAVGILRDNGVQSDDMRVNVHANPPLRLIGLTADGVQLRASDMSIQDLSADAVDVTLGEVDLRGQTFQTVEGRLDGVRLTPPGGTTVEARSVEITGPPDAAEVTLRLDEENVERTIRSQVARVLNAPVTSVTLTAPDELAIDAEGATVSGFLSVDRGGGLIFREASGRFVFDVFRAAADEPVRLHSVNVIDGALVVTAIVDLLAARP